MVLILFCFIVRLLREELQLLHDPGSYVGEVVKVMGKNKVMVKVQPEGKYSTSGHSPKNHLCIDKFLLDYSR